MKASTLALDDAVIHVVQEGEGPDIVWVPGGDQRGQDWHDQFAAFGDFRNTSYDPRGAGATVSHMPPPWPISTFGRDCAAVIREFCEPPVVLVGLSMGALVAEEVACEFPELLRVAIPMGTAGHKTGFLKEWEEAEIAFRRAGGALPEDFAIAHYATLMYPSEVLGDDELWATVKPVVAAAYANRDGAMLAAQWQACVDFSAMDRLPHCPVSIHVIAFSQDMQTPPARGRQVANAAKHGHFHLLEGLGHVSLIGHRPDVVNAKIREIIEGLG